MSTPFSAHRGRRADAWLLFAMAAALHGCGGGTGNERDSGAEKTTLSVAASDPDGDALRYEWRVTAGTIENRNAARTTWTLPRGPGLHFAYVMVSDGRGGYAEQQYAVGSDALDEPATPPAPRAFPQAASAPAADGTAVRIRLRQGGEQRFGTAASGNERQVYMPDVTVRVRGAGVVVTGITDLSGELNLPQLAPGTYEADCATPSGSLQPCATPTFEVQADRSSVVGKALAIAPANNLRLHGHVAMAEDRVCGTQNEFFRIQTAATVQLLQADGRPLGPARRVNRFGDYALDAPVGIAERLTLRIECGADREDVVLAPDADADLRDRLQRSVPVERSHRFANRRPVIERVLANGPDGNVRGRTVVEERGAVSTGLPGGVRFLSYKGTDSALSACMYYRSFGAVQGCDAQGAMQGAISFDDWRRAHGFAPFRDGLEEVSATYINERDLNLVRRMFAKRTAAGHIAFYVCNNPGPEGRSQAEVDEVIGFGLVDERRVACVAMEWSPTPGVDAGRPFTKFLTFGPDGGLLASVNLDQRGEKFLPGACVACHGGSRVGARFPESGTPSPLLGARFLPFDTGNYLFSSHAGLGESAQGAAFRRLNELVVATDGGFAAATPTGRLVEGWYRADPNRLDKAFVPDVPGWRADAEKAAFYRDVVGRACRTCHIALGSDFDWDARPARFDPADPIMRTHVCGGTSDLAVNASMPNALASLNRLLDPAAADVEAIRRRMERYIGCSAPAQDPLFPRR